MANINLAPGTQYLALVRKRRRRLFMLSGLLLVLLFIVWGGLFFVNNDLKAKQKNLADQIQTIDLDIAKLGEDGKRVVLFQNRLQAVDRLLNQHISWDPLLNEIERLLPAPTVLNEITADMNNSSIEVRGRTTDIDTVAQTLASLNGDDNNSTIFTQGSFGGVDREQTGEGDEAQSRVTFSVTFTFDQSSFSNNQ